MGEKLTKADEIVLSFRLASGDFLSELRMPMPSTPAEADRASLRWLDFMATGLRISAEKMDASWPTGRAALREATDE